MVGSIQDIHERVVTEKELKRSNEELEQFAYAVSHDLKGPIRGVGYLITYLEEDLSEYLGIDSEATRNARSHITQSRQLIQRMNGLIKGLLEYASIRYEKGSHEHYSAGDVIGDILAEQAIHEAAIEWTRGDYPILGERFRLYQVLSNLVSNAIKHHHNPKIAKINIRIEELGDMYRFLIKDNGPGIDARFHKKVFQMFQTLKPRDEFESTGIGLTLVKKIVDSKGGAIEMESSPDQGSLFVFSWPKREPDRPGL